MNQEHMHEHSADASHGSHHEHASHSAASNKFSFNLSGIDWKKEVMDAIEILKLNKTKMHEVAGREKATTVGIVFIVIPQIVSVILSAILLSRYFSSWQFYLIPGLTSIISPFLLIYAFHLAATQVFKAKGELFPFFRVMSYISVITVLTPVVTLLTFVSWGLAGLAGLVSLVAGIWMLIVAYHLLQDMYKLTNQNTVLSMIIGIVAVAIVTGIVNAIFLPKLEDLAKDINVNIRY